MAAPVDIGRFDPSAVPAATPAFGARLLQSAPETAELDSRGRNRSSSIDSKIRHGHRRSLSPRPTPWGRDRASTVDSQTLKGRRRDEFALDAALAGLSRGRAWSATAAERRGSEGAGSYGGGGGFHGFGQPAAVDPGAGAARVDGRQPLTEGQIELYASKTAEHDLNELFKFDEPGSLAWRQVPVRHRNLPYSFFEDTATLGGGGGGGGFLSSVQEGDASAGPATPLADFASPNLDSLLGTPMAAGQFTYPEPHIGGGAARGGSSLATMSMAAMDEDIIDQVMATGGHGPEVGADPAGGGGFILPEAPAQAADAMDEEFLSNLDLDF
eukprot:m.162141 g.162141  ORF g.162141 m.162141 type:complete len:327 (+) comp14596_c0_seq4:215-1195(+)